MTRLLYQVPYLEQFMYVDCWAGAYGKMWRIGKKRVISKNVVHLKKCGVFKKNPSELERLGKCDVFRKMLPISKNVAQMGK